MQAAEAMRDSVARKSNETGAALIVGLIILVALTLLSLSAMRNTMLEERMAGNFRDRSLAFQGAETAMRDAEAYLRQANLPPFNGSQPGLLGLTTGSGSTGFWSSFDWANNSRRAASSLSYLKEQPRYVVEELPAIAPATESQKFGALREQGIYRITARSTGGGGTAVVILQGTIQR